MKKDTYTVFAVLTDGTEVTVYSLYRSIEEAKEGKERFDNKYNCSECWIERN
ncbi:hypothetical protein FACS1894111_06130 [Clostridia bacterium]|nr:hypothetical protein FACS1894111_06130 [Clostridia bacterium]